MRINNDKDKITNGTNKLIKKQNITKENINGYMLNLVPGIGMNTAIEILKNFDDNIYNLINQLKNYNSYCIEILNSITIKSRKLSKKIIKNIDYYLK